VKIAYISNSVIPSRTANSINVMKMCGAFRREGHDVLLLSPHRAKDKEPGIPDVYGYYGITERFPIRHLPYPNVRGRDWVYSYYVRRELKMFGPDLVYGRHLMGCVHALKSDHPTRFELHFPVWERSTRDHALFQRLARDLKLERIVAITSALKRMCVNERLFPHEKIIVAPDGADPIDDFSPMPDWPGRKDMLQVGYVGHLYPGRGIDIIIHLAEEMDDVDFHIIGGTELDIRYWNSKTNWKHVFFHGHVPPRNVSKYRNNCDILLAPYQDVVAVADGREDTCSVMSPLKIFEYMASKKPIIASDLPAIREILNGENAILVRHDSVQDWKEAIRSLDRKQERDRLALRAYQDFITTYTWQHRARRVLGQEI